MRQYKSSPYEKGIVMEINDQEKKLIVLKQDGQLVSAPYRPDVDIGQELIFIKKSKRTWNTKWMSIAASIVLITSSIFAFWPFTSPKVETVYSIETDQTYVELSTSKQRVVQVNAHNEQTQKVINQIKDWEDQSVDDVVYEYVQKAHKKGALDKNDQVLITTKANTKNSLRQLKKKIERALPEEMEVYALHVPEALYDQAKKEKMPPGTFAIRMLAQKENLDTKQLRLSEMMRLDPVQHFLAFAPETDADWFRILLTNSYVTIAQNEQDNAKETQDATNSNTNTDTYTETEVKNTTTKQSSTNTTETQHQTKQSNTQTKEKDPVVDSPSHQKPSTGHYTNNPDCEPSRNEDQNQKEPLSEPSEEPKEEPITNKPNSSLRQRRSLTMSKTMT